VKKHPKLAIYLDAGVNWYKYNS